MVSFNQLCVPFRTSDPASTSSAPPPVDNNKLRTKVNYTTPSFKMLQLFNVSWCILLGKTETHLICISLKILNMFHWLNILFFLPATWLRGCFKQKGNPDKNVYKRFLDCLSHYRKNCVKGITSELQLHVVYIIIGPLCGWFTAFLELTENADSGVKTLALKFCRMFQWFCKDLRKMRNLIVIVFLPQMTRLKCSKVT